MQILGNETGPENTGDPEMQIQTFPAGDFGNREILTVCDSAAEDAFEEECERVARMHAKDRTLDTTIVRAVDGWGSIQKERRIS